jgi:SAM-dependent methyltransferase
MVTIYQDYDDEPEDSFLPLPEDLACRFYALEMDGYTADAEFFLPLLPRRGTFLELGCGTGRITGKIATQEGVSRYIIGIDTSISMLRLARRKRHPSGQPLHYLCMDMVQLAFSIQFDAILIPYNTLNLLRTEDNILECLRGCGRLLRPGGMLLIQIFIPTEDFIRRKKTFQFQMFDRPGGGKIIKEIIKHHAPRTQSIHIEERFRVRPMREGQAKEDWHTTYTVAGFSADQWLRLFGDIGFSPTNIYGDYAGRPWHEAPSSTLIATLTLQ